MKWLIIGLGNPGKKYDNTKHNVGFNIVDEYLNKNNITANKLKFNGLIFETKINTETVYITKPQTFMNLSGDFARSFCDYFNIEADNILVIYDDIAFDVGKFKVKNSGSAGGHNGMKDIISKIGTDKITRLKVGVGRASGKVLSDDVLSNFSKEESKSINYLSTEIFNNLIEDFILLSKEKLMTKYNTK